MYDLIEKVLYANDYRCRQVRCATKFEEFSVDLSQTQKDWPDAAGGRSLPHLNQSRRGPDMFWTKQGAMVMIRAEHAGDLDPNHLAGHLKASTLDMVLGNPPCVPIFVSVGLMYISDPAFLTAARMSSGSEQRSTMVPLLVTALYEEAALDWPDVLFDYLDAATCEHRIREYASLLTSVDKVVVPLPQHQVRLLERRCIGSAVCGRRSSGE